MFKLLALLLLSVGAIAWMIRRAKRCPSTSLGTALSERSESKGCSSCGCGVAELGEKPSSRV